MDLSLHRLSVMPCLLVEAADRRDQDQEEEAEHEVRGRPQPFVQFHAEVEEEEGDDRDRESPRTGRQGISRPACRLRNAEGRKDQRVSQERDRSVMAA